MKICFNPYIYTDNCWFPKRREHVVQVVDCCTIGCLVRLENEGTKYQNVESCHIFMH
jgi:hypothetical protein